jgi:hypothetical protein
MIQVLVLALRAFGENLLSDHHILLNLLGLRGVFGLFVVDGTVLLARSIVILLVDVLEQLALAPRPLLDVYPMALVAVVELWTVNRRLLFILALLTLKHLLSLINLPPARPLIVARVGRLLPLPIRRLSPRWLQTLLPHLTVRRCIEGGPHPVFYIYQPDAIRSLEAIQLLHLLTRAQLHRLGLKLLFSHFVRLLS